MRTEPPPSPGGSTTAPRALDRQLDVLDVARHLPGPLFDVLEALALALARASATAPRLAGEPDAAAVALCRAAADLPIEVAFALTEAARAFKAPEAPKALSKPPELRALPGGGKSSSPAPPSHRPALRCLPALAAR